MLEEQTQRVTNVVAEQIHEHPLVTGDRTAPRLLESRAQAVANGVGTRGEPQPRDGAAACVGAVVTIELLHLGAELLAHVAGKQP